MPSQRTLPPAVEGLGSFSCNFFVWLVSAFWCHEPFRARTAILSGMHPWPAGYGGALVASPSGLMEGAGWCSSSATCFLAGLGYSLISKSCWERDVGATAIANSRADSPFSVSIETKQSFVWFVLFTCVQQLRFAFKPTTWNKCYIYGIAKLFTVSNCSCCTQFIHLELSKTSLVLIHITSCAFPFLVPALRYAPHQGFGAFRWELSCALRALVESTLLLALLYN